MDITYEVHVFKNGEFFDVYGDNYLSIEDARRDIRQALKDYPDGTDYRICKVTEQYI